MKGGEGRMMTWREGWRRRATWRKERRVTRGWHGQEAGDGEIMVWVKRWARWEAGGEATQRLSSLLLVLDPLRHYAFNLSASRPLHPTFPTDIHSTLASTHPHVSS